HGHKLLYENRRVLKQDLVARYAGATEEHLRAGLSPHATDPKMMMFEYERGPRLDRLISLNVADLEEEFGFHYDRLELQVEAGLRSVQIRRKVVDWVMGVWKKQAAEKIEQGTGVMSETALVFENPDSLDGSFRELARLPGVDALAPMSISVDVEISAIVH